MKYYNTSKIDKKNAVYNLIIGERSNGKTYALLKKVLGIYLKTGSQFGYVRRWKEDITGRRAQRLFSGLNESGEVEKMSEGKYTGVHYYAGKFYLCNYDDAGKPIYGESTLFGFTFALSDGEHDKSTSFPNVTTVVFDEFLTNKVYLVDEFVLFMNTISTIVRRRTDVKIYMLGNTVNKFAPYFTEMGITNIMKMKQGTIDVYQYGTSELSLAVEYCKTEDNGNKEHTNKYFAFDNPKLTMITGGAWELAIYPHIPVKFKPKDVLLKYYIEFNGATFQCNIINVEEYYFTYIHNKTTEIKDDAFIYSLDIRGEMNYNTNIFKPLNRTQEKIAWFFKNNKVFYQNNEVGDTISNFIKMCKG